MEYKKKNFLGGNQNYNPENGQYEPALVGSNGEVVKDADNDGFAHENKPKDAVKKELDRYESDQDEQKYLDQINRDIDDYNKNPEKWFDDDLNDELLDKLYNKYNGDDNKMLDELRKTDWGMDNGDLQGIVENYMDNRGEGILDRLDRKNKKPDYDSIEKSLPQNMRWKEFDVQDDGTLYWVTQQHFDENDLNKAKDVLKQNGIDKAYFVVRDDSDYDYEDDLGSGKGYIVDAKNDKIYQPEENLNSKRNVFNREIEQLEKAGLKPNEFRSRPYYSPYGSQYIYNSDKGRVSRDENGKYSAWNIEKGAVEDDLDTFEQAMDVYNKGARTPRTADKIFKYFGADRNNYGNDYDDFLRGDLKEDDLDRKLRNDYEKKLLDSGYEKVTDDRYNTIYRPKNAQLEDGNNIAMKNWQNSSRYEGEPMRTRNYKVMSRVSPDYQLLNFGDFGKGYEGYVPIGKVGKDFTVDTNSLGLAYVGKENADILKQASMYGFNNVREINKRLSKVKNPRVKELGEKALNIYKQLGDKGFAKEQLKNENKEYADIGKQIKQKFGVDVSKELFDYIKNLK